MANKIVFANPSRTMPVSVTGRSCQLDCGHCGGYYLNHMTPVEEAGPFYLSHRAQSYLVSGGCRLDGKVPIFEALDEVRRLGDLGRVNIHAGLVETEEEAAEIGSVADVVSFDFVGSTDVIKSVYRIDRTVEDYLRSFRILKNYCRVVPHICIGLNGGLPSGEIEALKILSECSADGVALIIFIPTPSTRFADRQPPEIQHVNQVMESARALFDDSTVRLGCMRPKGSYRDRVDTLAIDAGVDIIVQPSKAAVTYAVDQGYEVSWIRECCVF